MENQIQTSNKDTNSQNTLRKQIGNTTYVVGVHFSKTSKETIEDKIERLVLNDFEKLSKNFEK